MEIDDADIFRKLIAPISLEEFFSEYWEKKVLYIPRDDPNYYNNILTFDEVDEYLSRTDLRYPYIRLVQEGRELPLNNYSYDSVFGENNFQGNLDLDKLFQLYNDGATMCMQMQHLALPKLRTFSNHIERFFEFRTQSTLFLTPPKSQGFTSHFDSHDFFIFQIYGQKQWKIYDDAVSLPLSGDRVLDTEVEVKGSPCFEPMIKPGDCLYVPRGTYHEALTNKETSLQISLGVFPYLWTDVIKKIVDDLTKKHVDFRKSSITPTMSSEKTLDNEFKKLLSTIKNEGNPKIIINDLRRKSLSKQSKDCKGRLIDLEKLPFISIDSTIKMRDIHVSVQKTVEEINLFFYDKEISLPTYLELELEYILSTNTFSVSEIPGNLDDKSKITLVSKLIEEGLLRFSLAS